MAKVPIAPNRAYTTFGNYKCPYSVGEVQRSGVVGSGIDAAIVRSEYVRIKGKIRDGCAQKGEAKAAERPCPKRGDMDDQ